MKSATVGVGIKAHQQQALRRTRNPMGDTVADSQGLQDLFGSQGKAETNDPLEQALSAMFSRDGLPRPRRLEDGSLVVQ